MHLMPQMGKTFKNIQSFVLPIFLYHFCIIFHNNACFSNALRQLNTLNYADGCFSVPLNQGFSLLTMGGLSRRLDRHIIT